MGQRTLNSLHWAWLAAVLAAALVLRTRHLDYPALSIDEAESSINALTVLERGYPADQYLGLPIFENTLVRPWPGGHAEYEFKDISYSDRGAAVYHGWLPLYAIAGSYWLAGIAPDVATDPPRVQMTARDIWWRTVAARIPASCCGMLLVVTAYFAARTMAGRDAALVAATIAALAPPTVRVAREARYYSATHLLSLLSCWMVWLMARRGLWRDFICGGIAFSLLFYTHVLSFVVALLVWAACTPLMLRRPGGMAKLAAFAAILVVAIVPWALATGFPGEARSAVPAARQLMSFPEDYLEYLRTHWKVSCALGLSMFGLGGGFLLRRKLPATLLAPFATSGGPILLLAAWLAVGFVAFFMLVPAPSAFLWRLTLSVQAPGIVLCAILVTAGASAIGSRVAALAAIALGAVMLMLPAVRRPLSAPPPWNQPVYTAIEYLRSQQFTPGTRIYATPLHHLTLTLYSGLPVQSTAPIHRHFFDEYPGDVLILETVYRGQSVSDAEVRAAAEAAGLSPSEEDVDRWTFLLSTQRLRQDLELRGTRPQPAYEALPEFLLPLAVRLGTEPARREDDDGRWDNPAMFRGFETADKWGFWQVFFYRFADPAARSGAGLNYADRIKGARAVVLESTWVAFHSPAAE